jgi:hypothetical protein
MYDSQCLTLARAFVDDLHVPAKAEARSHRLAQVIQNAIEDEMNDFEQEDTEAEGAKYRAEYEATKDIVAFDRERQESIERVYEAADMERKRQREEGAS